MAMELKVDGHKVFAATGGKDFDPQLPVILFVHGASMNRTVWSAQARYFAHHGHAVLAVDLPGHGNSEGPLLPNIEAMADWLIAVLDAAGVEKAALAGHSMGSLPVIEAAARHPERVERIVLLGTAVPMPVTDALLDNARANNHAAFDMVTVWGHAKSSQIGGNKAPGMWVTGGGLRLLERGGDGVLYNDMKACNDYTTGLEAAAKVQCPATVIMGTGDMMTPPRGAKALLAALPDVKTITLQGSGHMMMAERPNETLDALIAALK
jgi:pimeloyl-ACP methyl ester carboxylesterase